jgi:curved DNA-binding protein CbpA
MITDDKETFYDTLDISPNATAHEVREAYVRTKSTYTKDSLALYTIISPEEREEVLKTIEEAYLILSNHEKRREYDRSFGLINTSNPFEGKVISIDRAGSPDTQSSEAIQSHVESVPEAHPSTAATGGSDEITVGPPEGTFLNVEDSARSSAPAVAASPTRAKPPNHLFEVRSPSAELDAALLHAIEIEEEWKGHFLRRVRDAYKISIEEMAGITKVTKTYLLAVEEENYQRLPAPVYVRGFVIQMAKVLRLPHEKVAGAYLARYNRQRTD